MASESIGVFFFLILNFKIPLVPALKMFIITKSYIPGFLILKKAFRMVFEKTKKTGNYREIFGKTIISLG